MPRIAGVDVPNEKRIEVAIQYIHGIGITLAETVTPVEYWLLSAHTRSPLTKTAASCTGNRTR